MSLFIKEINTIFEKIKQKHNLKGDVIVEKPKDESYGDFATNFALINAKINNKNPKDLAQLLLTELQSYKIFSNVTIANPGFINITLNNEILKEVIFAIIEKKHDYGKSPSKNLKYNLELVSANPTGYLHVGHARNGVIGDCVARILKFAGYTVETEYYTNDAGNQINIAASTLFYHYKKLLNLQVEKPTEMYGGDMYIEIAKMFITEYGDKYGSYSIVDNKISDATTHEIFKQKSISLFMNEIKKQLISLDVNIDIYTSEAEMYHNDEIDKMLDIYKKSKKTYELDGALWLKTTEFGDDKDRVLKKSNGDYTYITPDLACHNIRFNKSKADKYVNFWGGDHHGYITRMNAGLALLGHKLGILEIDMIQMVRLMKDGQEFKMSKRKGTAVWLIDLLEMIGKDSIRYMLASKPPSSHMDFDLDIIVEKNSTNPLYYVQYATARCSKIINKAKKEKLFIQTSDFDLLTNDKEKQLIILMDSFNKTVEYSATSRFPSVVCDFIQNLAKKFHSYYADTKIFDENNKILTEQRVQLVAAVYQVLTNAFGLIGINVVDEM